MKYTKIGAIAFSRSDRAIHTCQCTMQLKTSAAALQYHNMATAHSAIASYLNSAQFHGRQSCQKITFSC